MSSADVQSLEAREAEAPLIAGVRGLRPADLPAPPATVVGVLRACADERSDSRKLAEVVARDPALSAEVLRIVNSAFFGFSRQIKTVAHAVTVLGERALRHYVLCLAVREALKPGAAPGLDTTPYWTASLRRAVAARLLARAASIEPEEAFTVGLLQDLGLAALFHARPEQAGLWKRFLAADPEARYALEREVFGATHDEVGAALARLWAFPDDLAEAIGGHHRAISRGDPRPVAKLARLALCADWLAEVFNEGERRHAVQRARALLAEHWGLREDRADELMEAVAQGVGEAGRMLGFEVQEGPSFQHVLREAHLALAEENLSFQELNWRLQHTLDEREALARRLGHEIDMARLVQRSLLPETGSEAVDVDLFAGLNVPARELSGDFYDFFPTQDGRYCFNLADVAGKGVDAALLMAKASSLFHCLGKRVPDPMRLLALLNAELCERPVKGMFVTMFAGLYDPASGRITVANAGHPPGLLFDRYGEVTVIPASGPPLGVLAQSELTAVEHDLQGGSLYVFSDGLLEARTRAGSRLGYEGAIELIRSVRAHPKRVRLARMLEFLERSADAHDDITVLVVGA